MKKKILSLLLVSTMVAGLCLSGCSSSNTKTENQATTAEEGSEGTKTTNSGETVFTIGYTQEPKSFDPKYINGTAATLSCFDCYDTLLNFNDAGTEVLPGLAEKWEQVDDLTYKYKIKEGVKFCDGTDMTMEDVLFSMERVKSETYAMSYLFDFVDHWEITGDWEITCYLTEADVTWKYALCTVAGVVISKDAVEKAGEEYGSINGTVVGTGPYMRDSWTSGTEITLVKNPYYWGDPTTLDVDKVQYLIFADQATLALAVQAGQVDYTRGLPIDQMSIYEAISDYSINIYQGTSSTFLAFNTQKYPFDDANARKAVAYCIDKESITSLIGGQFAEVSKAVVFPESMFYMNTDAWNQFNDSAETYQQNYEKAKEALAASAYADGFEFEYWCATSGVNQAEMIQAMIDASGLPIKMIIHEYQAADQSAIAYGYASALDENGKRPYNMLGTGWLSDYLDPIGYLKCHFHSTQNYEGGANKAAWINTNYDAFIDESYVNPDDKERANLMIQAYQYVIEDCPYVSLFQQLDRYIISNEFDYTEGPAFFWNFSVANVKLK
ncbi:ABC transporter substrate-binding protein [Anaerosporobacter sp.]|uniref:ABC transporter substrate-binding protein n=1 Tax=Anaerosporobacter sp. TaxID=1872529 RepID=UPI00286F5E6C|nr:ABC transporter substrate-binding protein [Anaerosporobacter sp.]